MPILFVGSKTVMTAVGFVLCKIGRGHFQIEATRLQLASKLLGGKEAVSEVGDVMNKSLVV